MIIRKISTFSGLPGLDVSIFTPQNTNDRFEIGIIFRWIYNICYAIRVHISLYNNKFSNRNSNNNIQAERVRRVRGVRHFKSAAETFWTGVERMELPMARLSSATRVYWCKISGYVFGSVRVLQLWSNRDDFMGSFLQLKYFRSFCREINLVQKKSFSKKLNVGFLSIWKWY